MDKNIIKKITLSLEAGPPKAREKHFDYVADARLDRSEPIDSDEQAPVEITTRGLFEPLDEHRCKIGDGEASFSLVSGCFRTVYGPGLNFFASLGSPVVETFDAYDRLNQLINHAVVELAAHEIGGWSVRMEEISTQALAPTSCAGVGGFERFRRGGRSE